MRLLIVGLVIIILICFLYFKAPNKELEGFQVLKGTWQEHQPLNVTSGNEELFRITNTVLSSPTKFYRDIDKLTLPASANKQFNEWIEKGFISPVKDQMLCGGCWAFATCGILSDRLSIATNGRWRTPYGLSEQYLISCGENLGMKLYQGCQGGIPYFAMDALLEDGVPEDVDCVNCKRAPPSGPVKVNRVGVVNPNDRSLCEKIGRFGETEYTWWQNGCDGNASCGITPASTCPCSQIKSELTTHLKASSQGQENKYKTIGEAHSYTAHTADNRLRAVDLWPEIPDSVKAKNVERMKKAIYYYGPIAVGFSISSDFYDYWPKATADNYYKYDGVSQMTGGHAVIIVGWKTVSDGTPVWIVKNNWGSTSGYGFDTMWTNPKTGEVEKQYPGGFWNHRMGYNDCYIESNATGCFPNLQVPQVKKFLPKTINKEWFKAMTLRDVYTATQEAEIPEQDVIEEEEPVKKPPSGPAPTPAMLLTSEMFKVITLNPNNISIDSIKSFFGTAKSLYMIGGTSAEAVTQVIDQLPEKPMEHTEIVAFLKELGVETYTIIAGRDKTGMFFSIAGTPTAWKNVTPNIVKSATPTKLANDIYFKFLGLNNKDVIVELQELK